MSDHTNQGLNRAEVRKEKKKNMFLNLAIGIVALLIVVISASMFIGGDDDQVAVDNDNEAEENLNVNENEEEINEQNNGENETGETASGNNGDSGIEEESDNAGADSESADIDDGSSANNEGTANDEDSSAETAEVTEGDWGPIGTVQEEPFTAVYDRDHVNWDEMVRALEYAMNRSENEMIIEWLGNGGDHQTAEGTVSLRENRSEAYQITLSWVENEGWMPVTKEELSTNPYQ